MHGILFDIDGTLVKVGGAGREALARGAAAAFTIALDRAREAAGAMDFRGRIDPLLIDELTVRLGFDPGRFDAALQQHYLEALPETLRSARLELMPGVRELIDVLEQRGEIVGLLTGNIREAARLKLACFGLDHLVDRPGGFGEDGRDRVDVARAAVRAMRRAGVVPDDVIAVGDTEHDVAAARAAGARTVAVATGWTPIEALEASRPDVLLRDLSDPSSLLNLIRSNPPLV